MNERHREVEAWLQKVYAGEAVPKYEVNERTLTLLSELAKRNEQAEQSAALVLEDLNLKAEEYSAEADRLARLLERLCLGTESLSQSGKVSLKTLTSATQLLKASGASSTSLLLASSDLTQEKLQLQKSRSDEQQLCTQLFNRSKTVLQRSSAIKKNLQASCEQAASEKSEGKTKEKEIVFWQSKAKQYRRSITDLQKELTASGCDESVYHGTLVRKSEELAQVNSRLHAVKAKLDSYRMLPPDLTLARVKVEEAKQELASIEAYISQHVDLMHM